MKTVTLGALALLCAGIASSPVLATPVGSGLMTVSSDQQNNVQQVGNKSWGKKKFWGHRRHRHHHGFSSFSSFPFVFGLGLAAPYYYDDDGPDCIGRWHRHYSGRLHCHGRLVWY
jgi:hypothetical protein